VPTVVPYVEEPLATKRALNAADPKVREAALRQASDIATPVYHAWKAQLVTGGLSWQAFQSAASANRNAWRNWLNSDLSWRDALGGLVVQLNQKAPRVTLTLDA
jgi:hypothetical protein